MDDSVAPIAALQGFAQEIVRLQQEVIRLQQERDIDPTMQIFTKRRFLEDCARLDAPVGVVLIDLNHFKYFNDTYGHSTGDVFLSGVGQLFQRIIRAEQDSAYKIGGDEFVLFIGDMVTPAATCAFLTRLVDRMEQLQLDCGPAGIDMSVGCAFASPTLWREKDPRDFIHVLRDYADSAMYTAKRTKGPYEISAVGTVYVHAVEVYDDETVTVMSEKIQK